MTKQEKLEKLEAWVYHLRNEHRIKKGIDYTYMIKYNEMRVLTNLIWMDELREHAKEFEVKVNSWFAYN